MLNRIFLTTSTLAMVASGVFANEPLSNDSIAFIALTSAKQLNDMTALVGADFYEDIMALGDDPDNIQSEIGQFSDALLNPDSFPTPLTQTLSLTSRIETLTNTLGFNPLVMPSNSAAVPYPQSLTGNIDALQQRLGGHVNDTTTQRVGSVGGNLQKASLDAMVGVDVGGLTRRGLAEKLGNPLATDQTLAVRIGAPSGSVTDPIFTRLGLPAKTDLAQTIGTTRATSIADRLGDPGVNFASLSTAIGAGNGESIATQLVGSAGPDTSLLKVIGNPSGANPDADPLYNRLGAPAKIDLAQTIGTDRNTIGDRLGDPGANFASLSAAIGAGNSESLATQLVGTGLTETSLAKRIGDPLNSVSSSIYDRLGQPGTPTPTLDNAIGVTGNGTIAAKLGNTGGTDSSLAAKIGDPFNDTTIPLYNRIGSPGTGTPSLDGAIGVTAVGSLAQKLGNTQAGDQSIAQRIGQPAGLASTTIYDRLGDPGPLASLDIMLGVAATPTGSIAQKLGNTNNADTSIAARIGNPTGVASASIYDRLGQPGTTTATLDNMLGVVSNQTIAGKLGNTGGSDTTLAVRIGGVASASIYDRLGDPGPLASLNNMLGVSGTGTLAEKLGNAGSGATSLSDRIGGVAATSIYDRLGDPGSLVSLNNMLGVSGTGTLAQKLGNDGPGTTSLSDRIGGGAATSIYERLGDPGSLLSLNNMLGVSGTGTLAQKLGNAGSGTTSLSDRIGGVTATSLYDRLGDPGSLVSLNNMLGVSGTATIAQKLGNTGGSDTTLAVRIGGVASASIYDRLGDPGPSQSLDNRIGVTGTATIAQKLGNNNSGDPSLAAMIGNPLLNTSASLYDQIGSPGLELINLDQAIGVAGGASLMQKLGNIGAGDISLMIRIGNPLNNTQLSIYEHLGNPSPFVGLGDAIGAGGGQSIAEQLVGTAGNSLLKSIGQPNGAVDTLYTRLGTPELAGVSSNLATIVGGTETTLALRIGDPKPQLADGPKGLITKIRKVNDVNTGSYSTYASYPYFNTVYNMTNYSSGAEPEVIQDVKAFNAAGSIYDQLDAFLNLLNDAVTKANAPDAGSAASGIPQVVYLNFGSTPFTSLQDVITALRVKA